MSQELSDSPSSGSASGKMGTRDPGRSRLPHKYFVLRVPSGTDWMLNGRAGRDVTGARWRLISRGNN